MSLSHTEYQCLRGLHVYSVKKEKRNELEMSIWSHPKDEKDSRCLFADTISVAAFIAGAEYLKPRSQAGSS